MDEPNSGNSARRAGGTNYFHSLFQLMLVPLTDQAQPETSGGWGVREVVW